MKKKEKKEVPGTASPTTPPAPLRARISRLGHTRTWFKYETHRTFRRRRECVANYNRQRRMKLSTDCHESMGPAHVLAWGDDRRTQVTNPLARPIYSLADASPSNTHCCSPGNLPVSTARGRRGLEVLGVRSQVSGNPRATSGEFQSLQWNWFPVCPACSAIPTAMVRRL
jgi:hypothetical protein